MSDPDGCSRLHPSFPVSSPPSTLPRQQDPKSRVNRGCKRIYRFGEVHTLPRDSAIPVPRPWAISVPLKEPLGSSRLTRILKLQVKMPQKSCLTSGQDQDRWCARCLEMISMSPRSASRYRKKSKCLYAAQWAGVHPPSHTSIVSCHRHYFCCRIGEIDVKGS